MKRSSFIKLMLATTAGAGALAACGGTDSTTTDAADASGPVRVWFMQGSVSDEAIAYLEEEFAKANPDRELSVEIQQWDGILSKLQTSLASDTESPDIVETGNTQSAAFTSVGAFADLSEAYEDLGGSKLIPSFVEAGEVDGLKYALPLYAGARGIYYRKDLLEAAGIAVPTTIDELQQAILDLTEANPEDVDGFSGIYFAAVDIHGVESYMFAAGGDYATLEGDEWVGQLSSDDSIEALNMVQEIFLKGTAYANDSSDGQKNLQQPFNEGKVGMLIGTGHVGTLIDQELWDADKVGVMPIPSAVAGTPGQTFAGGSSVSVSAKAQHPEGARAVLDIIFSEGFQKQIAADGWTPGNTDYADEVGGAFGEISKEVIENSKLTPNSANWATLVGDSSLQDFFTQIAGEGDVVSLAEDLDAKMEQVLNA